MRMAGTFDRWLLQIFQSAEFAMAKEKRVGNLKLPTRFHVGRCETDLRMS
jgi:hypothetical protein